MGCGSDGDSRRAAELSYGFELCRGDVNGCPRMLRGCYLHVGAVVFFCLEGVGGGCSGVSLMWASPFLLSREVMGDMSRTYFVRIPPFVNFNNIQKY